MEQKMKEITLREANQQFSKLIRDVEETGETFIVLRNGKPAAKIVPPEEGGKRKLSPEQEAALQRFLEAARTSTFKSDGPWTRDELYER
jgi:prevent-host-death family protein